MDSEHGESLDEENKEILYRVDERTETIDNRINNVVDAVEDNQDDIDELQGQVKRNTTIITTITGGLSLISLWVADKVSRFV